LEGWKEYETNKKTTQARLRNQIHNWPTATTRDWKGCGNAVQRKDGKHRLDTLEAVVMFGLPAPVNHSTDGSRQESLEPYVRNWQTFAHGTHNRGETPHRQVVKGLVTGTKAKTQCLTVDQVFAEEVKGTSRLESWGTLTSYDWKNTDCSTQVYLSDQVEGRTERQWATPIMGDSHLASTPEVAQKRIEEGKVTLSRQNPGKLNSRWVETLMGLPIGWTIPSCTRPVIIAPMNCDCLETESSQPPQNEHLEH
jgi:hypothetical protein